MPVPQCRAYGFTDYSSVQIEVLHWFWLLQNNKTVLQALCRHLFCFTYHWV